MSEGDLNKRNTEGVVAVLREMEKTVRHQQVALNTFSQIVGDLMIRVNALENAEKLRVIKAMGNGPTT